MGRRYVAYGLQLHSSFDLPGAPARTATGLPLLRLGRIAPAQLDELWSGHGEPAIWSGVLADGERLALELGRSGEVLFSYGDRARFLLDATRRVLSCAPAEDGVSWQRALLGKVLCQVSSLRGYEALHAGAVESPSGVVAFAGPSGAGKSTLVAEFVRRGWPLFTDDFLTLAPAQTGVLAYPGTPHMSVAALGDHTPDLRGHGTTIAELAGERWLRVARSSTGPQHVRMLCLLRRADGLQLELAHLPGTPLALAPYILGFRGGAERQRHRFELYSDLVSSAGLGELCGDLGDPPSQLADLVERALEECEAPAPAAALSGADRRMRSLGRPVVTVGGAA